MQYSSLVIANIIEYNFQFMSNLFVESEISLWHNSGADLADMGLFWGGDNKLVITPYELDPLFVDDVCQLLGYRNIKCIFTKTPSASICNDIVADTETVEAIRKLFSTSPAIEIVVWGATDQLYDLIQRLRELGWAVISSEIAPKTNRWLHLYLDSKAGFREFCSNLQTSIPSLRLPEGFTCSNKEIAIKASAYFATQRREFIMKANNGTGGYNTLIYTKRELDRGLAWIEKDIRHRMSFDHFWDASPIVIEEYFSYFENGSPYATTIDLLISPEGEVKLLGGGKMIMRYRNLYSGIVTGLGSLDLVIEAAMTKIAFEIGTSMKEAGYIGWFDIDFVVSQAGALYLTEINARRTSPAHVFEIAHALMGEHWAMQCGLYANDHLRLHGRTRPNYREIREQFWQFNSASSNRKVKAIPTIASLSLSRPVPYMGYVVIAPDAVQATEYALQLESSILHTIGRNID